LKSTHSLPNWKGPLFEAGCFLGACFFWIGGFFFAAAGFAFAFAFSVASFCFFFATTCSTFLAGDGLLFLLGFVSNANVVDLLFLVSAASFLLILFFSRRSGPGSL
jgi:hypothetical protein